VSAGRDPGTGRYRYVHKTVEGSKRVAQRAADELATEVQHGMHLAARWSAADLLEKWMLRLETQDRAPSAMIWYRSAIDVTCAGAGFDRINQANGRRSRRFLRRAPEAGPPYPRRPEVPRRPVSRPAPGREVGLIDRNPKCNACHTEAPSLLGPFHGLKARSSRQLELTRQIPCQSRSGLLRADRALLNGLASVAPHVVFRRRPRSLDRLENAHGPADSPGRRYPYPLF
jgi:hypothetical protein